MYQQLRRYLPFCNFVVAITGVMFQTTVLYPWHKQLSKELAEIKVGLVKLPNQNKIPNKSNQILWNIADDP